jgi:hypothetical protein
LRSLSIFALRWLRGWGYRGRHPGIIYGGALALLGGAGIGAAIWAQSQFAAFGRLPAQFRPAIVAVLVLFLFVSGGFMFILTESIRLSGSRVGAVLSTLPLTTSEIRVLLWLPVFIASLGIQVLLFVPAVAAFSALRFPLEQSLLAALLSLICGCGAAALVIALVRRTLSGGEWASTRYPVMLLGWMGLCGIEIWQTIVEIGTGRSEAWRVVLLAPWLARQAGVGRIASPQSSAIILGILAALLLLLWVGDRSSGIDYPRVAWLWSSRWKAPLVTLELTRMLRSPYLVANLIGGEVLALGLAFALWKLPPVVRPYLFVAVLSTMMLFCALPLALIRGLTRAKWPPPLLLGYGPIEWTMAQVAIGMVLALALATPPLLVCIWLLGSANAVLMLSLPLLALSSGVALYVGWLTPSGADDPLGQAVSTFSLFIAIQLLELGVDHALRAKTAGWAFSVLLIGSLGIAAAAILERRRWSQLVGSVRHA